MKNLRAGIALLAVFACFAISPKVIRQLIGVRSPILRSSMKDDQGKEHPAQEILPSTAKP
jgi:hypothetical protein